MKFKKVDLHNYCSGHAGRLILQEAQLSSRDRAMRRVN